jgi:hypothetical protein
LKPSYFVGLFAKQLVSAAVGTTAAIYTYHMWYSSVYDLSLNADTGMVSFNPRPPEALSVTQANQDTFTGGAAALTNSLTTNYARVSNLRGGTDSNGNPIATYVASCTGIVQDEATTGYTPTSIQAASIGLCADACTAATELSVSGGCQIFQYDTTATGTNCKLYRSALNKQLTANADKATDTTTTQCWAKKVMIDATRDTNCDLLGNYYGFTDTGCRRRLTTATTNSSGAVTAASQVRSDVTVLRQDAYCGRFSLQPSVCEDTTGCKWTGQMCKPVGVSNCDRGYYDTDTSRTTCTACPSGKTTLNNNSTVSTDCVNCSTMSETVAVPLDTGGFPNSGCPVRPKTWPYQAGMCGHTGKLCSAIGATCAPFHAPSTTSNKCFEQRGQECEKINNSGRATSECNASNLVAKCLGKDGQGRDKCYCRKSGDRSCSSYKWRTSTEPWSG